MAEPPKSYFDLFKNSEDRVKYPAGHVIFKEGEPGKEMYVVSSGAVELRLGERRLEAIEPGGILGEMALVDSSPRSATAVAATDCELVAIDEKRFQFLLQRVPFFAIEVMRVMAQRLRRLSREEAQA